MAPWLRLALRSVRLLLALTVAALPAYGAVTAYAPAAQAAEPGPGTSAGPDRSGFLAHSDRGSPAAGPSLLPMPSDSASASYRPPAAEPSRAGSLAGEGRRRPGRTDGPAAEVEGNDTPVPTRAPASVRPEEPETTDLSTAALPTAGLSTAALPTAGLSTAALPTVAPTAPAATDEAGLDAARPPHRPPAQNAAQKSEGAGGPVLQILPLGSGLVLIGLGLGLAFLGLRIRRS
ncbi:hypothetical protein ACH47Z_14235 [Streptomyces sp. NPDC020192]|uniref:hypothetical protein n=1 Tax=Streptomyces sp. NPDC020192 TaxID=3365066 RepID=UPI0037B46ED3